MRRLLQLFISLFLLPTCVCADTGLQIEHVDASFFPKVTLTIRLPNELTGFERFLVTENGRLISGARSKGIVGSLRRLELSFLSAAKRAGRQVVEIEFEDQRARASYYSSRWRRLGQKRGHTLTFRATGPRWQAIPCRLVAMHESGRFFEDLTSVGGYGRLGTGFIAPPGTYYAELRLVGLELPLEHFRFEVKADRSTNVHRRFGYLNLPTKIQGIQSAEAVQLEIERRPTRYPRLRCSLAWLLSHLPKALPPQVLPLPAGTYRIRLHSTGADDVVIPSLDCTADIIAGQRTPFPAGFACK